MNTRYPPARDKNEGSMVKVNIPRIMIAGTGSGCGKTTVTCAILGAFSAGGRKIGAFKCGPDYIDIMFHRKLAGGRCTNLDGFFFDDTTLKELLAQNGSGNEINIIERVKGYYDGIGESEEPSSYALASATSTPAALVVSAKGSAASLLAVIGGFLDFETDSGIRAVILNNCTESVYRRLKPAIMRQFGERVHPAGYFPTLPDCSLNSRHLGLVTAGEIGDLDQKLARLAETAKRCIDLNGLERIARNVVPLEHMPVSIPTAGEQRETGSAVPTEYTAAVPRANDNVETGAAPLEHMSVSIPTAGEQKEAGGADPTGYTAVVPQTKKNVETGGAVPAGYTQVLFRKQDTPVRIAVARDRAFCFYYEDSLDVLRQMGASLIPFSPMRDSSLPEDTDGIYLGGGYPELYAKQLSENTGMLRAIRNAVLDGMPCIAECGGFLYLNRAIDGTEMAGVFPGDCFDTKKLTRFGYVTLRAEKDNMICGAGEEIRGHEFHHWDCTDNGEDFTAIRLDGRSWKCCRAGDTYYAGFPHFHFRANLRFAENFYQACIREKERR